MDELFATNTGPSATAGDGAFERFLTAAIAAIITIMFSWRLLATEENLVGGEGPTGGAVGGAVGGEVPKVVMKKAIKMAKAAGYTEESRALEKEKGLLEEGREDTEEIGSGVNTVTSFDPDTQPLVTCWEKSSSLDDSGEMNLDESGLEVGDLNQGFNGFSRGSPEYRDILVDDTYQPYDGEMEFGDDIQPRELDSDEEEMYCATMLETIMEEDSDDMGSNSTGSDVDSLGRTADFGYFDLHIEGEEEGDYTSEGGCTVHVIDDGSELISSTISVTTKSSKRLKKDDESASDDDTNFSQNVADDSDDVHRESAQFPDDIADDSNSDGSDESVITVVTRQISSEKDSPVSANEFTFPNTGQIEIVPVRTHAADQFRHNSPVTVQSTFQALQPDEPYPTEDPHAPHSDCGISGINEGLKAEQSTEVPDIPSPSLDSGVYSIGTRVDIDQTNRLLVIGGEKMDKIDINSNVDFLSEQSANQMKLSSASLGESGDMGDVKVKTDDHSATSGESPESERRLDILFDQSPDVPEYSDAYVSSAVEKTPKGFIFSRFELETTDYQEKLYTTDRPTHTVVAKLVAEEKFVPTEQTDSEIREKFSDLDDGAKLTTSPETFLKATSQVTDIDATELKSEEIPVGTVAVEEAKNLDTNNDDQSGVVKRVHPVSRTTAPAEKYLRMDKTDGTKSHRIVPVKKELSVADRLMKIDTSRFRSGSKADPAGFPKRISSLNQGESPPEKVLKIIAGETDVDSHDAQARRPVDAKEQRLHLTTEAQETLIDDPSTFRSRLEINLKPDYGEKLTQKPGEPRETNVDDIDILASDQSQTSDKNTASVTEMGHRETMIDNVTIQAKKSESTVYSWKQDGPKETLIDDVSGPHLRRTAKPSTTVGGAKETLIDDVSVPVTTYDHAKREKSLTGRIEGPRETLIDDVIVPKANAEGMQKDHKTKQHGGGPKETVIDDITTPETNSERDQTKNRSRHLVGGPKETLIGDVTTPEVRSKTDQSENTTSYPVSGPKETLIDDVLLTEPSQPQSKTIDTTEKIIKLQTRGLKETLIDDPSEIMKIQGPDRGSRETIIDDRSVTKPYQGRGYRMEIEQPVKILKINTESRETCIDEVDNQSQTPGYSETDGIHETNIDDVPERFLNTNRENIQRFRDRVSLNREGSCEVFDDSTGNELDRSFGDITNRSEEILDEVGTSLKSTNIDDDEEEAWTVDEVIQEFTLKTDPDGITTYIPGKTEHRILQTSPEHKHSAPGTPKDSPLHSSEISPEHEQYKEVSRDKKTDGSTDRPTPKPRRSIRSDDTTQVITSESDPQRSKETGIRIGPDGKLHLDAIEEVSWKPLTDSETAEKSASAVKKFVPEDVIISGSHLIPHPRRQVYSEADKSNPLLALETGDIGSYGTRSDLAHLSSDLEAEAEIDFEMFSGGVGIPIATEHVTRPLSESSPKQELPDVVDGNESPDESGFPSMEVRRTILEEFKRSKSVEHLSYKSWGNIEEESVFMSNTPEKFSPEVDRSPVVKPSPVMSPPIIPDSPVVSPPSKAFLVSKKGSKSVPNLAGIDDSPSINAPISHTIQASHTKKSQSPHRSSTKSQPESSPVSRKPSRYTKKSATVSSAPVVQVSPVIKAAAKTRSTELQQPSRQVIHTNIDDEIDAAVSTERAQGSTAVPSSVPTVSKQKIETSFGAEIESSPMISPSSAFVSASPLVNQSPVIMPPPSAQLSKSDIQVQESPEVKHPLPMLITSATRNANSIEASPTISLSPKISAVSSPKEEKLPRDTKSASTTRSPLIESSPSIPMSPIVQPSKASDMSQKVTSTPVIPDSPSIQISKTTVIPPSPTIPNSPEIQASPMIVQSPAINASPMIQESPVIPASPMIQESPVIPVSPLIQDSPVIPASPNIPESPSVSIPASPTVNLDDSSSEDQSFRSQKRYKSLKEIKRKYSSKNFKSLHMPPTPNIGQFVVPAKAILTARHRINASRKRFLSEENLISENRLSDQFKEHKESLANTTKYKSPRRPDQKRPSSYSSQDSLETFALMYPNFFLDESSEYRPSIDELHKNCIFTPEGRKDIMNKTLSIENLTLDLRAHLKRFGSVTSLVETDIDTGETSETQPFPETDLDLWFSLQQPIDRAVSMTDLRSEQSHRSGKGRFANRHVPKSKSLQTLETNIDDEEDDLKRTPSVHELRITKSLSKLNIPDWFKSSNLSKSGSCILRHGSTSTMSSWGFNPSLTSSPCPSVTPSGNVVIKTRVSPSSSMRFLKSPKFASVPTLPKTPEERFPPQKPVKLPSEKLRNEPKAKGLEKIAIVPFAQIRAMFESKGANAKAGKKESVRQDSVTSKTSQRSPVPVPVVTLSSGESPSEIVQLEGSPKRPRSPPVKPPSNLGTKFTTVPTGRTVSPLNNASYPQKPLSPTGTTSPLRSFSPTDSASPQRPLSPTGSFGSQRPLSPVGSASPQRPLSPVGSASPQRPLSPAESTSPRSLSPLGSLNSSMEGSRSFSPSDKMRPINPDGPHNRSISPGGTVSSPRSISPGGNLGPRDINLSGGTSSPDRPSSPESPIGGPVVKPGPRSILGPTVRFEEKETLEIKDNKPQKPGKKPDFFKRLQVFQRSSPSDKDKDKKQKAEDSSKPSPKQVPVTKLKSAFEPFTRKDNDSSRSIESAPTIQAPTSAPKSPNNKDPGSKSVEEAPVIHAPNSRPIESAPTYPTYQDLPECQPIDASYRVLAPPVSRRSRDNHTNDRNSHSHEETRRETKQESSASPVRVGNSGQSLPTPVLTATPFSRNSASDPSKRSLKETTV